MNFFPWPQRGWYCTRTFVFTDAIEAQVSPLVRPAFATPRPTVGVAGDDAGTPTARISPVVVTSPALVAASAASTLFVPSGTNSERSATISAAGTLQALSTSPGCEISSPIVAKLVRASTWLLLRMYRTPPLVTRLPRVPEQQNR